MTFLVEGTLYFFVTVFLSLFSYYSFETIQSSFVDCSVFEPTDISTNSRED